MIEKKNKIKNIVKNKKGEMYIELAVELLIFVMVIALILNIFLFITRKQNMDYCAKAMVEAATYYGTTTGTQIDKIYEELVNETGIEFEYSFQQSAYYDNDDERVQLGQQIEVTLSADTNLSGFGFSIPIVMKSTHSGLSEQYIKD